MGSFVFLLSFALECGTNKGKRGSLLINGTLKIIHLEKQFINTFKNYSAGEAWSEKPEKS